MEIRFTKMHGIGNDYIYLDCMDGAKGSTGLTGIGCRNAVSYKANGMVSGKRHDEDVSPAELSRKMSARHFGVGSDGLILMCPSNVADARMRMFNADGSEGRMCGNAIRCMARYLHDNGIVRKTQMTIETLSGIKKIWIYPHSSLVSVNMGQADFTPANIPVISDKDEVVGETVTVGGEEYTMTCVSMGNPHAVIFTDNIDALNLEQIGPLFEHNSMFPDRVNTEFVEVIGPRELKMRVWERGSGETYACGTGATAIVAAAIRAGICSVDEDVTVHLKGGDLTILMEKNRDIIMTGDAEKVFEGVYEYTAE